MKVERISWSDIDSLSVCGQRHYYARIEKIVRPPGVSMIRGSSVHRSAETSLGYKLANGGEMLPVEALESVAADYVKDAMDGELLIDGDYDGMTIAEVRGVVTDEAVSLAREHRQHLAPQITPAAIEVKVEVPPSSALPATFVGIIDVIDGERIRDLKTKRKSPGKADADLSDQLTGYEILYRAKEGKPSHGLALDFVWRTPKSGKVSHATQETTRDVSDMAVFVRRANAAIRTLEAEVFLPAPVDSWVCSPKYCGYTELCPFYRGRKRPES